MIAVGRISKSVGTRGEVKVTPLTGETERFTRLTKVWIGRDETSLEQCTVSSVRLTRSGVVLGVQEIASRTVADTKRGNLIFVRDEDALKLAPGTYFIHDVVGMEVSTEGGEVIGVIREVLQLPANDVWVVMRGDKEILIPAVNEIIRSVDVQRRSVVIHPIEGLLE